MGTLFRGIFERAGIEVICSGVNTFYSNRYLAAKCDIVIVSVPIHETIGVIEEIAPIMNKNQLLCDFTSIKTPPVEAMLKSEARVMGLHPMFGPSLSSIKGQTIVATPVRCSESDKKLLFDIFRNEGASVCIMTPGEHDRVMSIVQGLVHFATLSVAEAVRNTLEKSEQSGDKLTLDTVISVMSPVYRIEMGLIGRILGQDAGLYGDILKMNPSVVPVIEEMSAAVSKLKGIVEDDSKESFDDFDRFFLNNREAFSSYLPQATADTDKLIVAMTKED
ncbi:MAG: prephenate dehydrogenase/arogenate dehydrogenase family protein [Methanomicrobium sp.]|nr:prephenate dehydrogenase/arogenate dehydrogenase family protein [Methanomicrobium sp.]